MDILEYNYKPFNTMYDEICNYNDICNNFIINLLIIYSTFITVIMLIKQFKVHEIQKNNEEEILLANYNTYEKTLVYKEELSNLFEKKINIYKKLNTYWFEGRCKKEGHLLREKINGIYPTDIIVNKLTVNDLVLGLIEDKVYQSIIKDIQTTNNELLIIAKKAGLFEETSELLDDLQDYIKPTNPFYNEYKNTIVNM